MAPGRTQAAAAELGLQLPGGQSQHTQWIISDHIKAPPNHLHSNTLKGQTQRAPEPFWIKSCSVGRAPPSWSSTVLSGCGQFLQPIGLRVNPSHWGASSNQASHTTGGCTQPTHGWGSVPGVPKWNDQGGCTTVPYRIPTILGHSTQPERQQLNALQRNKHREAAKMRRQRNMS